MSALEPDLISLAVTHVYYRPGDPFSLISAYLALIPQGLMVVYVTLIYARREIEVVLMFIGQLLSEVANWILKRIIKEERPKGIFIRGLFHWQLIVRYHWRRVWDAQFTFTIHDLFCCVCHALLTISVTPVFKNVY